MDGRWTTHTQGRSLRKLYRIAIILMSASCSLYSRMDGKHWRSWINGHVVIWRIFKAVTEFGFIKRIRICPRTMSSLIRETGNSQEVVSHRRTGRTSWSYRMIYMHMMGFEKGDIFELNVIFELRIPKESFRMQFSKPELHTYKVLKIYTSQWRWCIIVYYIQT